MASRATQAISRGGDGTRDALHAAALIDLHWPDSAGKSLDRSISNLRTASLLGTSADVLADLAAALLVRGRIHGNARDLIEALESAMLAVSLDTTHVAAAFNVAVAMSRLRLHEQATRAWSRVLSVGVSGEWEVAARSFLATDSSIAFPAQQPSLGELARPGRADSIVRHDRQWAREFGWESALPAWGTATIAGDSTSADTALTAARLLGDALQRNNGDASLSMAVRAIQSGAHVPELAFAHAAFGRARRLYEQSQYAASVAVLDSVIDRGKGSPALVTWATLWKGIDVAQGGSPQPATPLFEKVIREGGDTPSAASARARWSLASTLLRLEKSEEARALLLESQRLFEALGEHANAGTAMHLESLALGRLGALDQQRSRLLTSTTYLAASRKSVRLHNVLYALAEEANEMSFSRAALAIQDEGVSVARNSGDPLSVAEALVAVARIRRALGQPDWERLTLDSARRTLSGALPGTRTDWVAADLRLAMADGDVDERPDSAVAKLTQSIALFQGVRLPARVLPGLLVRARAHIRRGDPASARRDLIEVLSSAEREMGLTRSAVLRRTFARAAEDAFERLALLDLATGDDIAALHTVERGRALLLGGSAPIEPTTRPSRDVVLDVALIRDTLFTWVLTPDTISLVRTPVPPDFVTVTHDLRSMLERGLDAAAVDSGLAQLHDWLFRPVERWLGDSGVVTIVAGGEIAGLPLSAALDRRSRRYMVDRYAIRVAPTLRSALATRQGSQAPDRIVIAADPSFTDEQVPALSRLPGAREEARVVAASYRSAVVLTDSMASWPTVRRAMRGGGVFHFAGHARMTETQRSGVELFMAGNGPAARITDDSLATLSSSGVTLMVFSACETAQLPRGLAGGLSGLGWAAQRAGARGAVGTLWRVDDAQTATFMTAFHRAYREDGDPAVALRVAALQVKQQRGPGGASAWAGFQYSGR